MIHDHAPQLGGRARSRVPRLALAASLAAGCLSLGLGPALAAGHATVAVGSRGQKMQIAWRDARNARFSMPGMHSNSYTLLHNGKAYIVANGRVMSAKMFSGMMRRGAAKSAQNEPSGRPHLVGPKGREKIAGIAGQRYLIHWNAAHVSPSMQDKPVVLTGNRRVRELWQVWAAYAATMGANRSSMARSAHVATEMNKLFNGRGVLRMGHSFCLVKIDGHAPPASAFALPAHASSSNPAMKMLGNVFGH